MVKVRDKSPEVRKQKRDCCEGGEVMRVLHKERQRCANEEREAGKEIILSFFSRIELDSFKYDILLLWCSVFFKLLDERSYQHKLLILSQCCAVQGYFSITCRKITLNVFIFGCCTNVYVHACFDVHQCSERLPLILSGSTALVVSVNRLLHYIMHTHFLIILRDLT